MVARQKLSLVFKYETLDGGEILRTIFEVLDEAGVDSDLCQFYEKSLSRARAIAHFKKLNKRHFNVAVGGLEIRYAALSGFHYDFVTIAAEKPSPVDWPTWVHRLRPLGVFTMAWLVDAEYDYWQNAEDPIEYTTLGRDYRHLPMKSNGLPYPLTQQIVDTSTNPGRRILKPGYVEAVGAKMWMGEGFWELGKATKREILEADWLHTQAHDDALVSICLADQPFTSAEGQAGILQDRLRALLFGVEPTLPRGLKT